MYFDVHMKACLHLCLRYEPPEKYYLNLTKEIQRIRLSLGITDNNILEYNNHEYNCINKKALCLWVFFPLQQGTVQCKRDVDFRNLMVSWVILIPALNWI